MEFNRCSRCGNFYISKDNVCTKCAAKDNFEFNTFKKYVEENGIGQNLDTISGITGIAVKNLNRFLNYPEFTKEFKNAKGINRNIKL